MNEQLTHPAAVEGPPPAPAGAGTPAFTPVRRSISGHFMYCLRHYARFNGRATRAEYWSFVLITSLVGVVLMTGMILGLVREMNAEQETGHEPIVCVAACTPEAEVAEPGCPAPGKEFPGAGALSEGGVAAQAEAGTEEKSLDAENSASEDTLTEKTGLQEAERRFSSAQREDLQPLGAIVCLIVAVEGLSRYPWAFVPFLLVVLWWVATLVPLLAVSWRRLHDTGLSGAWYLVSFTPFIGGLVFFVLTLLDSEPGANRFGPPTKYP